MGNDSSKKHELSQSQPEVFDGEKKKKNNCSKSTGTRMAHGAFMATNPAGALIARAIRSSRSNKKSDATDEDGC